MKRFLSIIGALAALALAGPALAATVPLTVTYELPTTGCTTVNGTPVDPCDNVPLTGGAALTAIEFVVSTSPIPANFSGSPTHSVGGTNTGMSTTVNVTNGQTVYVRARARNAQGVSVWTNEVSQLFNITVIPNSFTIAIGAIPPP